MRCSQVPSNKVFRKGTRSLRGGEESETRRARSEVFAPCRRAQLPAPERLADEVKGKEKLQLDPTRPSQCCGPVLYPACTGRLFSPWSCGRGFRLRRHRVCGLLGSIAAKAEPHRSPWPVVRSAAGLLPLCCALPVSLALALDLERVNVERRQRIGSPWECSRGVLRPWKDGDDLMAVQGLCGVSWGLL